MPSLGKRLSAKSTQWGVPENPSQDVWWLRCPPSLTLYGEPNVKKNSVRKL